MSGEGEVADGRGGGSDARRPSPRSAVRSTLGLVVATRVIVLGAGVAGLGAALAGAWLVIRQWPLLAPGLGGLIALAAVGVGVLPGGSIEVTGLARWWERMRRAWRRRAGVTLCPYCFHPVRLGDCAVVAARLDQWPFRIRATRVVRPAPMTLAGRFWRGLWGERLAGADAAAERWHYACSQCGEPLPRGFGEVRQRIVGLVGAVDAGVSHYLAALVQELRQGRLAGVGLAVCWPADEASSERYEREYGQPLFGERLELQATEPRTGTSDRPGDPLSFQLVFKRRRRWRGLAWEAGHAVLLALYDAPGEHLRREEELLAYCGQLVVADGLIVLVAPESLPGLGRQLSPRDDSLDERLPEGWRQADVRRTLETVTVAIAAGAGVGSGERLARPAAFALSKADLLDGVTPAGMARWSEWPEIDYDAPYNEGATAEIDARVRALLREHGDHWAIEASGRFEPNRWFAVSATGQAATEWRFREPIRPRRVVDPLVWLLWRLGDLPGK